MSLTLAQAAVALEVDSHLGSSPPGALPASRTEIQLACGATVALALAGLLLPSRARPTVRVASLAAGVFLLVLTCPINSAGAHAVQVCLLSLALCGCIALLDRRSGAGRLGTRVALAGLVALAAEGAFTFVARSHAVGYTLAARHWFSRYWGLANGQLYRDLEHAEDGRPHLFVLGDSFVAGVGIADPHDRFSDRLQGLLPGYQVHNLGWNGSDTRNELERLEAYPFRPSVLVLSYYINDITGAAEEPGRPRPPFTPYQDLPRALRWVVKRSYALDYLYWLAPHDDLAWQGAFIEHAFNRPEAVQRHEADLQRIVDWAKERGVRLIGVLFPDLTRVQASGPWLAPAEGVFARNAVPVLDVRELVRGQPTSRTTVNRNDAHPSVWLHAEVARALAARIAGPESEK